MQINWDPRRISLTRREVSDALRKGKPSVVLGRTEIGLEMNSFMLQPGEDQIIAERLAAALRAHVE